MVNFTNARFSGGTVDFSFAEFSGGTIGFRSAQFFGGTVDFSDADDWSFPPVFPWTETPLRHCQQIVDGKTVKSSNRQYRPPAISHQRCHQRWSYQS
jgi:hypothetical protein